MKTSVLVRLCERENGKGQLHILRYNRRGSRGHTSKEPRSVHEILSSEELVGEEKRRIR